MGKLNLDISNTGHGQRLNEASMLARQSLVFLDA
jgi:hypothetical protein